jgi:hypothetical protein
MLRVDIESISMFIASACTAEIRAFVRGGTPGLARLRRVLPRIFEFYGVEGRYEQARVLIQCKLRPVQDGQRVTFEFKPEH